MSGAKEYLQVKFLKTLEPLSSLSVDKLEEIANKSKVEELPPGRVVFRQGEKDNRSTYLLSGTLELQITGNPRTETVKAKTSEARYPVAQEWPRPCTCRTKTNVVLLHIDSDLLEILLNDDPSGTYEVTEIGVEEDPESDWMLRFLQSPAFLQLPTENIQTILMRLDEKEYKSGQAVITQGESDEWYYIIKKGKCAVSRRPAPKAEEVRLALLGPGDGFGEEALITQGKRNATVTMKEDGVLMRLGKTDFHELLVKPMVRTVDHSTMMDMVKAGAALIDVRTNKEFTENGIKGAQNIPLSMLRIKAKDLNSTREHIVYCNDSTQSSAAAFLLAQQSLSVYVLAGGLNNQSKPFSPATNASTAAVTTAPTPQPVIPTLTSTVATSTNSKPPVVTAKVASDVDEKQFQDHKRQAQATAERANQYEKVHQQAEARSDSLREKADALRAQADRLAMKTANTEAIRQRAEAEIDQIKQETLIQRDQILATAKQEIEKEKEVAKQKEAEISRLRAEAEKARRDAEDELHRIQNEANSVNQRQHQLEEELKRAENEKVQSARAAEVARLIAKQEADKVKAEAEAIRQQAIKEAETLRQQMESRKVQMQAEETARLEKAHADARRKSELAISEAAKAAEDARRQAELEAETIRKQALKEAENLRLQIEREKQQAAEQNARIKAEEQLRRQEIELERQRALDEARKLAQQEAEQIRSRALQELQIKAREEARQQAEAEAQRQKNIDEVKRKTMETARLEAEAIRREALEEANRLRADMENTRKMVEEEARRARARIEENEFRLHAEEESHAREAEAAARRAAEEAGRRRNESQRLAEDTMRRAQEQTELQRKIEEARRREEHIAQLEAQRRAAEEEARRFAALEQQRAEEKARNDAFEQIRIAEEEARKEAEEMQRQALAQQAMQAAEERQRKARQMAESIKNKLSQHADQDERFTVTTSGPKLAKAKLHVVKDKTILEGEEDIFIFKAPSERPPSREEAEALLRQAETQLAEKSRKELPSFDIDYKDEEVPVMEVVNKDSEFSDSILLELDNITANSNPSHKREVMTDSFVVENTRARAKNKDERKKPSRRRTSLIALAASIIVMVAISVVAITRQTYLDVDQIAATKENDDSSQRGLAAIRTEVSSKNRTIVEDKVKTEAEMEFRQLLQEWQHGNDKKAK